MEGASHDLRQQRPDAVVSALRCFESWFGPYPWYEDGYKLVETPYLGMEHQSAVAYGNGYQNGYLGIDRSGTGLGLEWDFIIVHESVHEWWGNNLTTADLADLWVHEAFGTYAEALYVECLHDDEAGARYVRGLRRNVLNDRPIIPAYGVNAEGSGDMYDKGANMLHKIRQVHRRRRALARHPQGAQRGVLALHRHRRRDPPLHLRSLRAGSRPRLPSVPGDGSPTGLRVPDCGGPGGYPGRRCRPRGRRRG